MAKRLIQACIGLATGAALCAASLLLAQESLFNAPEPRRAVKLDQLDLKNSQPPASSISVEPLGFSAPANNYLGQRVSFVSLDFIDENRLLFTFRVPGLIHRVPQASGAADEERQIRALVLRLPSGTIEAEGLWTVHDRARYLWMLGGGSFLLRDRDNLETGDAALELKPYLHFSGPLLLLEMDPEQKILVTDSREPAATAKPGETSFEVPDLRPDQRQDDDSALAVRILRREQGQVMLVSRSRSVVHLPVNSDGYLEILRARGDGWLLNMNYFNGGSRILGEAESACPPLVDFLSLRELLITGCSPSGAGKLAAMTTEGRWLWESSISSAAIWPLIVKAPDGLRLARETLTVTHPVIGDSSLTLDEIKGQQVEVLNAADGKTVLVTAASPILDAGGNVAISPTGRRLAVLNAGAIQLFDLPSPPPLPERVPRPPGR
jgi:hypothetical protein